MKLDNHDRPKTHIYAKAHFPKCTHGRNWGFASEICEATATHTRRGYPDRLACAFHAFDALYSQAHDPDWVPIERGPSNP